MATIALPRPISAAHTRSASPRPLTATLHLEGINTSTACPVPIPNKHLPVCPPGPAPAQKPDTPPQSPPSKPTDTPSSLLYPPEKYKRHELESLVVYEIDASGVAAALDHTARQPIPEASSVFPFLHGLHPCNQIQQSFFIARRRTLRKTPRCLRGITLVKAGGDLSRSRLKGALAPEDFLETEAESPTFKDSDPREGFSVRNFQIQAAKCAMTSDIIVYGDNKNEILRCAQDIATAQESWADEQADQGHEVPHYSTFACSSSFDEFEKRHPDLVATNAQGQMTANVMDFFYQERSEMCTMTKASEIAHNVWLGPTPDPAIGPAVMDGDEKFDVMIECADLARMDHQALQELAKNPTGEEMDLPIRLEFPSSGSIMPPTWSHAEADGILEMCKWIYNVTHGIASEATETTTDEAGDSIMSPTTHEPPKNRRERRILIHSNDGYTESSLLALSYYTYATGLSVPKAWLDLHVSKKRNFFAYPSDVALLTSIAPRLLTESPVHQDKGLLQITELAKEEPQWMKSMDGSLPSRVTDYMYLGNLTHANNPDLLKNLGIGQILSVGETAAWLSGEVEMFGEDNVLAIQGVQDNGVDPLTKEFARCLDFIDRGKTRNTATLVHCRVGVSRSATICIAEVMRTYGLSFPKAYCFVRARRLNVIIQPHLRFAYELLKWEEKLQSEQKGFFKRDMEWPEIAREIAAINIPYARS